MVVCNEERRAGLTRILRGICVHFDSSLAPQGNEIFRRQAVDSDNFSFSEAMAQRTVSNAKSFHRQSPLVVDETFRDCLLTYDAKGAPDEPEAAGHALISGAASRRPQPGNGYQYIRLISQEKKLVSDNVRKILRLQTDGMHSKRVTLL